MHCWRVRMKNCTGGATAGVTVLIALLCSQAGLAASVEFERDIQPLLQEHCLKCHGPQKQKGGLRLDLKSSALAGGDSGQPAVVPGHSEQSQLWQLVASKDDAERMPPEGEPLSA